MISESSTIFGRAVDLPDSYIDLFNAHSKVSKYADGRDYLENNFEVDSRTKLKIAVAGDDEALQAAKFIDNFFHVSSEKDI